MAETEEIKPRATKTSCAEKISQIMRRLMEEQSLRESELARRVNLPQTTINRLLVAQTDDPRANTLRPIANYFGISIGQLIGDEPLPEKRYTGTRVLPQWTRWMSLPILDWQEIWAWRYQRERITTCEKHSWINTERKVSQDAFALNTTPFMEPKFNKGSIILVDPEIYPCDGHFVVVSFNGEAPTARQVLKDGGNVYLKPFDASLPTVQLCHLHIVYGTIIEMRYGLDHKEKK